MHLCGSVGSDSKITVERTHIHTLLSYGNVVLQTQKVVASFVGKMGELDNSIGMPLQLVDPSSSLG